MLHHTGEPDSGLAELDVLSFAISGTIIVDKT